MKRDPVEAFSTQLYYQFVNLANMHFSDEHTTGIETTRLSEEVFLTCTYTRERWGLRAFHFNDETLYNILVPIRMRDIGADRLLREEAKEVLKKVCKEFSTWYLDLDSHL